MPSLRDLPLKKQHGWALAPLIVGILIGMALFAGGGAALSYTNTESFCISCHEMRDNAYAEYQDTIHDKNRTGNRTICVDCHLPKEPVDMIIRKIKASMELYHHFVTGKLDTPEKYEEHRYDMALRVWTRMKQTDSRECRNCHDESAMDPDKQTEKALQEHAEGREKNQTCIDCHFAIAHFEPEGDIGPQEMDIRPVSN